jgi:hypothetical protein
MDRPQNRTSHPGSHCRFSLKSSPPFALHRLQCRHHLRNCHTPLQRCIHFLWKLDSILNYFFIKAVNLSAFLSRSIFSIFQPQLHRLHLGPMKTLSKGFPLRFHSH